MTTEFYYRKKPKLIAFDIGGTVFDDGPCKPYPGLDAIRRCCMNGIEVSTQRMVELWEEANREIKPTATPSGYSTDVPLSVILRQILFRTGLQTDLSMTELEVIFDRYNSTRSIAPGFRETVTALNQTGIQTAILSNNMMSGDALRLTLKKEVPELSPVFCVTSADLMLCKPCPNLFTACSAHCGIPTSEVWYAGNDFRCDVTGSLKAGMGAVYYNRIQSAPADGTLKEQAGAGWYLEICCWESLLHRLEGCR